MDEDERKYRECNFIGDVDELKKAVRLTGVEGFWSKIEGYSGGGIRYVFETFNVKLVFDDLTGDVQFVGADLPACVALRRKIAACAPTSLGPPLDDAEDAKISALDPWLDSESRIDDFIRLPDPLANLQNWSEPDRIAKRLFQGSAIAAANPAVIEKHGITHVVAVGHGLETPFRGKGVQYHTIAIYDAEGEDLRQHFEDAIAFIRQALRGSDQNTVLVHCQAGISRATTTMCAYLMQEYKIVGAYFHFSNSKWTMERALKHVESRRWVCPNAGFKRQLLQWEKELREKHGELK